jgi:hypothetical protein
MFTANIPKSPVRELLEMEPEAAKFEWVKIADRPWLYNREIATSIASFFSSKLF